MDFEKYFKKTIKKIQDWDIQSSDPLECNKLLCYLYSKSSGCFENKTKFFTFKLLTINYLK